MNNKYYYNSKDFHRLDEMSLDRVHNKIRKNIATRPASAAANASNELGTTDVEAIRDKIKKRQQQIAISKTPSQVPKPQPINASYYYVPSNNEYSIEEIFAMRKVKEDQKHYDDGYEDGYETALYNILEIIEDDASYSEVYESIGGYLEEGMMSNLEYKFKVDRNVKKSNKLNAKASHKVVGIDRLNYYKSLGANSGKAKFSPKGYIRSVSASNFSGIDYDKNKKHDIDKNINKLEKSLHKDDTKIINIRDKISKTKLRFKDDENQKRLENVKKRNTEIIKDLVLLK